MQGTRAAKLACKPAARGESCPEAASGAAGQPVRLTDSDPTASLSLRWCTLQARHWSLWQPNGWVNQQRARNGRSVESVTQRLASTSLARRLMQARQQIAGWRYSWLCFEHQISRRSIASVCLEGQLEPEAGPGQHPYC